MTAPDLRPRTVGELLDAAFFAYRRRFGRLLLVAMLVSLPALLVAALHAGDAATALSEWWDAVMEGARRNQRGDFAESLAASMRAGEKIQLIALLMGVLQSIERAGGVVTMSVAATAAIRREPTPSLAGIFSAAAARLPAAILAQVVIDYVLGTCVACCFPVGIVLTVMFSCTAVAIALERGPLETSARRAIPAAIRWAVVPFAAGIDGAVRSIRLTTHAPTLARGTAFLFFLLTFVGIANGVAMGLGALFAGKSGAWFWAQHCSEALLLPVWGLGVSFWYFDLLARREGADLQAAS